ncbi:MAG: 30S ribosomal protein S2 [Candidatus Aenigmarchaeota archaeon]|nr:30S ribosomal protein S2 [Candidatus Aenigmarchaeota archaeon]
MKKERLLLPREKYLSAGVHIGMTSKTADMQRFIYKIRPSGLAVMNIGLLDKRIGIAANMLSQRKKILVVSKKENGFEPARKFAEVVGAKATTGRFMPGSLTNPTYKEFFEPDILIVTDPGMDKQAIKEAVQMRIPIVGLADTFNETSYLDFILPCNNKGKKSLALIYWLLAKLIVEKRAAEKGEKVEFQLKPEDFGYEGQ